MFANNKFWLASTCCCLHQVGFDFIKMSRGGNGFSGGSDSRRHARLLFWWSVSVWEKFNIEASRCVCVSGCVRVCFGGVNRANAFVFLPPQRLCKSGDIVTVVTICYVEITFLPHSCCSQWVREADGWTDAQRERVREREREEEVVISQNATVCALTFRRRIEDFLSCHVGFSAARSFPAAPPSIRVWTKSTSPWRHWGFKKN